MWKGDVMPKLQFSQARYSITVPQSLVNALGWSKHDALEWKIDTKGQLILRKKDKEQ